MIVNNRSQSALRKNSGVHRDRPKLAESEMRRCARCKERKPTAANFRRDSRGYWRSWCNPCQLAAAREWRRRNRDELLDYQRRRNGSRPTVERACITPGCGRLFRSFKRDKCGSCRQRDYRQRVLHPRRARGDDQ